MPVRISGGARCSTTMSSVLLLLLMSIRWATADVRVSPVALYLSDQDRHERFTIENDGTRDKDVVIDIEFGYPVSDDQGMVSFRFVGSPDSHEPSAAGWIGVFPESFTLPAGGTQTVVVISSPPPDLPEGEYWARPVLTFRSTVHDTRGTVDEADETQLVLSVNYRHGSVLTGVNLESLSLERERQTVSVIVDMKRTGNAAFLGNLLCRLLANGVVVSRESTEVAVYHSLKRRIDFRVPDVKAGVFAVEAELNTNREGNKKNDILKAATTVSRREFIFMESPWKAPSISGKTRNLLPGSVLSPDQSLPQASNKLPGQKSLVGSPRVR